MAPWTRGLEQRRCPTCKPWKGKQPLVVAMTMVDGVCAQCARVGGTAREAPEPEPRPAPEPEPELTLFD